MTYHVSAYVPLPGATHSLEALTYYVYALCFCTRQNARDEDVARRVPLHLDAVRVREAVADGVVFGAGQAIDHVRGATTAALPARCHGHDASGCRGWGRGPAVLLKYGSNAHDVVEGTHADDPGPIGSLRKLLGDR